MKKILGFVLAIAILWILAANDYQSGSQPTGQAKIGGKAPAFTLKSLSGKTYSLSGAKGKPLVLNFWNSWCPPCKEETPELVKLHDRYRGKFHLYGINVTSNDTVGAVKLFSQDYKVDYPILLDRSGKVAKQYLIRGMPTTYLINAKGIIVGKIVGYLGPEVLRKKIQALVEK